MLNKLDFAIGIKAKVIAVATVIILAVIVCLSIYSYILNMRLEASESKIKNLESKIEETKAKCKAEKHDLVARVNDLEEGYYENMIASAKENLKKNKESRKNLIKEKEANKVIIEKAEDEKDFTPIWTRVNAVLQ